MFSSNVGFRRRTVSDGYNQLLQPSSGQRGSSNSQRLSLDESSSTTVKRIVLRKHKNNTEPLGHRGLAERIAQCEVENIDGFWSGRLSGQRRSLPTNLKHGEANPPEWGTALRSKYGTPLSAAERSQTSCRPRGPRPLSKVPSPVHESSHQNPSGNGNLSSGHSSSKTVHLPPVSTKSDPRAKTSEPFLSLTKSNDDMPATDRGLDLRLPYLPLLPPGLTYRQKPRDMTTLEKSSPEKEKKKRFAHLEMTLSKVVANKKPVLSREQPQGAVAQSTALVPPSLPRVLPTPISIPFIPTLPIPDFEPIYRPGSRPRSVRSAKSSKNGKSVRRKSPRKRKTGLARIVVELAKGEKVVAVDTEAIQEAAEVGDILAQLRKMKAA